VDVNNYFVLHRSSVSCRITLLQLMSHYLITHQALAQEPWIRNTPWKYPPWSLTC